MRGCDETTNGSPSVVPSKRSGKSGGLPIGSFQSSGEIPVDGLAN
jgi:hypothetical protein